MMDRPYTKGTAQTKGMEEGQSGGDGGEEESKGEFSDDSPHDFIRNAVTRLLQQLIRECSDDGEKQLQAGAQRPTAGRSKKQADTSSDAALARLLSNGQVLLDKRETFQALLKEWQEKRRFCDVPLHAIAECYGHMGGGRAVLKALHDYTPLPKDVTQIVARYCHEQGDSDAAILLQDSSSGIWDRALGAGLKWLFRNLRKRDFLTAYRTVEVIKSPGCHVKNPQQNTNQNQPPEAYSMRWVLVILHSGAEDLYTKAIRSFNSSTRLLVHKLTNMPSPPVVLTHLTTTNERKKKKAKKLTACVVHHQCLSGKTIRDIAERFLGHQGMYGFFQRNGGMKNRRWLDTHIPQNSPMFEVSPRLKKLNIHANCNANRTCMDEDCPFYCFAPDCRVAVRKPGGFGNSCWEWNTISDVRAGQTVLVLHPSTGKAIFDEVEMTVETVLDETNEEKQRLVPMALLPNGAMVTPGHPVVLSCFEQFPLSGAQWPLSLSPTTLWVKPRRHPAVETTRIAARHLRSVYNVVLASRGALLVAGPGQTKVPNRITGKSGVAAAAVLAAIKNMPTCTEATLVACSSLGQFCLGVDKDRESFFGSERVVETLRSYAASSSARREVGNAGDLRFSRVIPTGT